MVEGERRRPVSGVEVTAVRRPQLHERRLSCFENFEGKGSWTKTVAEAMKKSEGEMPTSENNK